MDDFLDFWQPSYIVPLEGSRQPNNDQSQPWYVNTINKAIDAAGSAYIIGERGYPQQQPMIYPQQYPQGYVVPGTTTQSPLSGVQLSNTTLMLLVGGALLFLLGTKKGR